jgi:hypothetical protein
MAWKTLLTLSVSVTLATISLAPTAVFAQFPGPPPMGPGGPPPIAAGGPPAFGGPPPMGAPGSAPRAGFGGPAPRLGAGAVLRGDLRPLGGVGAGGRGAPAVANSARAASFSHSRSGGYGYRSGSRYGYRAAYAAGAYSGYAYGHGYSSDSDCYRVYKRHRYILVCE